MFSGGRGYLRRVTASATRAGHSLQENPMSLIDKAKHTLEDAKGKIKEATGKAIGNEQMEYEGKVEQGKANFKQSGEHVRDAADSVKRAFKR